MVESTTKAGRTEIQLKMFAQAEEHVQQGLQLYEKLQDAGGKASGQELI